MPNPDLGLDGVSSKNRIKNYWDTVHFLFWLYVHIVVMSFINSQFTEFVKIYLNSNVLIHFFYNLFIQYSTSNCPSWLMFVPLSIMLLREALSTKGPHASAVAAAPY